MQEKEKKDSIEDLIENTFKNIKDNVCSNSIVGDTIKLSDNIWIVPISKIKVGIVSGGIGTPQKKSKQKELNAGSGSGYNITPVGFIVVVGNDVRFINTNIENDSMNKVIDSIANLCSEFLRSTSND